jgi:hypothetical protein
VRMVASFMAAILARKMPGLNAMPIPERPC